MNDKIKKNNNLKKNQVKKLERKKNQIEKHNNFTLDWKMKLKTNKTLTEEPKKKN